MRLFPCPLSRVCDAASPAGLCVVAEPSTSLAVAPGRLWETLADASPQTHASTARLPTTRRSGLCVIAGPRGRAREVSCRAAIRAWRTLAAWIWESTHRPATGYDIISVTSDRKRCPRVRQGVRAALRSAQSHRGPRDSAAQSDPESPATPRGPGVTGPRRHRRVPWRGPWRHRRGLGRGPWRHRRALVCQQTHALSRPSRPGGGGWLRSGESVRGNEGGGGSFGNSTRSAT